MIEYTVILKNTLIDSAIIFHNDVQSEYGISDYRVPSTL